MAVFGLLHLATFIDAQNDRLQRRLASLGPWAAAAALGFLLLIPMQGLVVARGLNTASLQSSRQLRQFERTLSQLRQDIQTAQDPVLALVDQAQQRASARLGGGVNFAALWPVVQRSQSVLLIAPAYGRCLCCDGLLARCRVVAAGSFPIFMEPPASSSLDVGLNNQKRQCV